MTEHIIKLECDASQIIEQVEGLKAMLTELQADRDRLSEERDQFLELASMRDARDAEMQELMRVNNEIVADRDRLDGLKEMLTELQAYRDAAIIDVLMEGPRFKSWNMSLLRYARELTEANTK